MSVIRMFQQPRFTLIRAEDGLIICSWSRSKWAGHIFGCGFLSSRWPRCSGLITRWLEYFLLLHLPPLRQPRRQLNSTVINVNECYLDISTIDQRFRGFRAAERLANWLSSCHRSIKRFCGQSSGKGQCQNQHESHSPFSISQIILLLTSHKSQMILLCGGQRR